MNYNEELVTYCNNCNSLYITVENSHDFCNVCGTVNDTSQVSIEEWLKVKNEKTDTKKKRTL
jgi:DNA-directed RNA polymerase subunit M/transcription elongation factor TFIIS